MRFPAAPPLVGPVAEPSTTPVRQLALADARRFARHPLFVVGTVLTLLVSVAFALDRYPDPLSWTVISAFFIGVFGFVVAHRLTTSMTRSGELVDVLPSRQRRRTLALCLACGVPLLAGSVCTVLWLLAVAALPPDVLPADGTMAWYGDYPWWYVTAALLALGPVATLGGPLLGVALARWAPFRGSALVGVVVLVLVCAQSAEFALPWRALVPYASIPDERVEKGIVMSSTFPPGIAMGWYLVFVLLLCALALVAAMLRDPRGRRPWWVTGGLLSVATVVAAALMLA